MQIYISPITQSIYYDLGTPDLRVKEYLIDKYKTYFKYIRQINMFHDLWSIILA